jgi:lipopolysaccharide export system permease protein
MILNRYLFKEILLSFLGTLLVLTLVIVGNSFVRLLADASAGQLPVDLLTESLFYVSTKNLIKLIPIALLIGMMLAFSRLYRDSEMIAMQAAGLSPHSLYRAIFTFVTPLTLGLAILVLYVNPWTESQYQNVRQQVDERPEAAGIPAGVFTTTHSSQGEFTLLTEDIDDDKSTMKRFFVHVRGKDNSEIVIWGESAALFINSVSNERVLEIHKGSRYELNSDESMSLVQFVEHGVSMPLKRSISSSRIASLPSADLFNSRNKEKLAELHWRLAIILSAPLMALLALPLSHTNPRQGRYSKVALGILIYAIYANALMTGRGLLEKGSTPDWLGLWWVHLLMLAFILWLIRHTFGRAK